ncbi:MAG TPA: hypothetical protein PKH07_19255, partial [bacterium]|nr:hypothetical protein [bacterium]
MMKRLFAAVFVFSVALYSAGSTFCAESPQSAQAVRLSPDLRQLAVSGKSQEVPVFVFLSGKADFKHLVKDAKTCRLAGETIVRGRVSVADLGKLSTLPGVAYVSGSGSRQAPVPPEPEITGKNP